MARYPAHAPGGAGRLGRPIPAADRGDLTAVPARPDEADPDSGERGPLLAPALARAIVAAVYFGFAAIALLWVLKLGFGFGETVLAGGLLTGLLGLQYFYFGRPGTDLHSTRAYVMLGAQACLAYLPLALFGQAWISQPPFVAASVLLMFAPRVAWPLFAAIVAGTGVAQYLTTGAWLDVVYILVNSATAGLYVCGFVRLARYIGELHQAREELATAAVAHERLRFARNLHGLLGFSLSAIAPRGELVLRLLRDDPERAGRELTEIMKIARRALAELRSIARLYRLPSLDDEAGTLASMLAASNTELRVDLDLRLLPPSTRATLAAVLRQAVALMVGDRETANCEIVLRRDGDRVVVDLRTDVAREIGDLPAMVSRMAGEVTSGMEADERFGLHVILPVAARAPEELSRVVGEPTGSLPQVATRLAGGLVVAVCCGLFLQAVLRLLEVTREFWDVALGTGGLLAALALQLAYFSRPGVRLRTPAGYLLLALMGVLVFAPWQPELAWVGLAGFLAGSALLVLRPVPGWSVVAAVVGSVLVSRVAAGLDLPDDLLYVFVTLDTALIVYGLTWMARTVRQLRATRQRLAEAALAQTRLRFAQDLHDLLGLSLSAITLKSELAHRLLSRDPDRARTVLTEMLEISRHALADVRSVADGYHEMSLDQECRTAHTLLTTAGLQVRMDVDDHDLPPETGTVLATVLREGVTNVLRHSKGRHCEITICADARSARLLIVNDGTTTLPNGDHSGSGIRNMSDRVTALGGTLTADTDDHGRFILRARIPLPPGEPRHRGGSWM